MKSLKEYIDENLVTGISQEVVPMAVSESKSDKLKKQLGAYAEELDTLMSTPARGMTGKEFDAKRLREEDLIEILESELRPIINDATDNAEKIIEKARSKSRDLETYDNILNDIKKSLPSEVNLSIGENIGPFNKYPISSDIRFMFSDKFLKEMGLQRYYFDPQTSIHIQFNDDGTINSYKIYK